MQLVVSTRASELNEPRSLLHGRESDGDCEGFVLAHKRFVLARETFVFDRAPCHLTTGESPLDARGFHLNRKDSALTETHSQVDVMASQRTKRTLPVDARERLVNARERRVDEKRSGVARAAFGLDTGVFHLDRSDSALNSG